MNQVAALIFRHSEGATIVPAKPLVCDLNKDNQHYSEPPWLLLIISVRAIPVIRSRSSLPKLSLEFQHRVLLELHPAKCFLTLRCTS